MKRGWTRLKHWLRNTSPPIRFCVYLTSFFALWLGWHFLDFFGLESLTKQQSEKIIMILSSPFYGWSNDIRGSDNIRESAHVQHVMRAQDVIRVVRVDDETLKNLPGGRHYPLRLQEHGEYLKAIIDAEPKVVMVDVRFSLLHKETEYREFAKTLSEARPPQPITVFFARGGDETSDAMQRVTLLTSFEDQCKATSCKIEGESIHLPNGVTVAFAATRWNAEDVYYPLWIGKNGQAEVPTAAMAIYKKICEANERPAWAECPLVPGAEVFKDQFKRNLVVQWGARPALGVVSEDPTRECRLARSSDRILPQWLERLLGEGFAGFVERYAEAIRLIFEDITTALAWTLGALFPGSEEILHPGEFYRAQPCLYTVVLSACSLLAENCIGDIGSLKGAAVLYGIDISDGEDKLVSPVNGEVSGVMLHAMALDNLLTYGTAYFRPSGEVSLCFDATVRYSIRYSRLLELAIWLLMVSPVCFVRATKQKNSASARIESGLQRLHSGFYWCFYFALILLLILLNTLWFHGQTSDWMGLVLLLPLLREHTPHEGKDRCRRRINQE